MRSSMFRQRFSDRDYDGRSWPGVCFQKCSEVTILMMHLFWFGCKRWWYWEWWSSWTGKRAPVRFPWEASCETASAVETAFDEIGMRSKQQLGVLWKPGCDRTAMFLKGWRSDSACLCFRGDAGEKEYASDIMHFLQSWSLKINVGYGRGRADD